MKVLIVVVLVMYLIPGLYVVTEAILEALEKKKKPITIIKPNKVNVLKLYRINITCPECNNDFTEEIKSTGNSNELVTCPECNSKIICSMEEK